METKQIKANPVLRSASFQPETINEEERTVELTWTTGASVMRVPFFSEPYNEELSLEKKHVRMGRLNNNAPLLNNHNSFRVQDAIGVVERAWIDGSEGKALVRFSKRDDVEPIFQDVKDGILRKISVGYRVYKYKEMTREGDKVRTLRAVDWEPFEVSLVGIPADDSASIRNNEIESNVCELEARNVDNQEGDNMSKKEVQAAPAEPQAPVVDLEKETREASLKAKQEEKQRISEIRSLCARHQMDDQFISEQIEGDKSISEVRELVLEKLAKKSEEGEVRNLNMDVTVDEKDKRREGIENAIEFNYAPGKAELNDNGKRFANYSLMDFAREVVGDKARGMSRSQIAERALSTSDFALALANVMGKRLRDAYQVAPQTFRPLVVESRLPDYKEVSRIQMGDTPSLKEVKEGGEYTYGSFGEGAEKYKVAKYGRLVSVTEETIVNDDLGGVLRTIGNFGSSASRKESEVIWAILTGTHLMADGNSLFHAQHGNLGTAGAIGDTKLTAALKAMREQKTLDGEDFLNLIPRFLIVGTAKEIEAKKYLATTVRPNQSSSVNPFAGSMDLIVEPRITDNAWFTAADPSQIDMIELGYLQGMAGPQLSRKEGFEVDGLTVKLKHVFGAKALDWRGFYKVPTA